MGNAEYMGVAPNNGIRSSTSHRIDPIVVPRTLHQDRQLRPSCARNGTCVRHRLLPLEGSPGAQGCCCSKGPLDRRARQGGTSALKTCPPAPTVSCGIVCWGCMISDRSDREQSDQSWGDVMQLSM